MRTITAFVVSVALAGPVLGEAAKDKKKGKPFEGLAMVELLGDMACAFCELGIGEECCTGLKIGETIFVVQGEVGEDLFDERKLGATKIIMGTISARDGILYLQARKAGDPKDPKAKPGATLRGELTKGKKGLAVRNGTGRIYVTGKAAGTLADLVGEPVVLRGDLTVNEAGEIVIAAREGKRYVPKKKAAK